MLSLLLCYLFFCVHVGYVDQVYPIGTIRAAAQVAEIAPERAKFVHMKVSMCLLVFYLFVIYTNLFLECAAFQLHGQRPAVH